MNAQQQRPIKINLNAVKRLAKEKVMYEKELKEAQDKVANCGCEPGSLEMKRYVDMATEAEQTLQDVEKRLADFKLKLKNALKDVKDQFPEDPLIVEALQLIE
ncbi:tubulin-specific chaperone A [Histomonas meleagridis]|uniref:tubulin-specific chaperone A n=1 Tax=Histomonas meleagridis TaxID=135588 RepID=UPI00355958B8|nr:tubulin-specific chaperone A [Histomonas meleagridis]KAH0806580.1 tubulin-specific chaperone A [Histomonas meleagridis]